MDYVDGLASWSLHSQHKAAGNSGFYKLWHNLYLLTPICKIRGKQLITKQLIKRINDIGYNVRFGF